MFLIEWIVVGLRFYYVSVVVFWLVWSWEGLIVSMGYLCLILIDWWEYGWMKFGWCGIKEIGMNFIVNECGWFILI